MTDVELTRGEKLLSEEFSKEFDIHMKVINDGPNGWVAQSHYTVRPVGWGKTPREAVLDIVYAKVKKLP